MNTTRFRDMSTEEQAVWRDRKQATRERGTFDDVELTESEVCGYLGLTSPELRRLEAEGRILSRWQSDVRRYRNRRDAQPECGVSWPRATIRRKAAASREVEE